MTKKAVLSLVDMVQDLTALVWRFDCKVTEGRLQITSQNFPYPGTHRRQHGWEDIGEVRQSGNSPAEIVNLANNAPVYLKPLEGESFPSKPVLLNAVRRESFRHKAKELLKDYLSAEIKQLEDDG